MTRLRLLVIVICELEEKIEEINRGELEDLEEMVVVCVDDESDLEKSDEFDESDESDESNELYGLEKLEETIIDCVNDEIELDNLEEYESNFDEKFWDEEGLCVLLRKDEFKIVRDRNIIELFIGTYSVSSDKVGDSLKSLMDSLLNELPTTKQGVCLEHTDMCWLLRDMVGNGGNIIDKIGDEIFEYIVTVVEMCEDEDTIWWTIEVFIEYPESKVACWLMQRLDLMMTELGGEVVDWMGHRNACELIWGMLRYKGDVDTKYRKYYSSVLNQQVCDLILNYMMRLIDRDENNQAKVL